MKTHYFRMQVYSEDTDTFGIVHHANYIKFMERARLDWFLSLGFRLDRMFDEGIFFVIKKIAIEYFAPARLYDEIEIITQQKSCRRVAVEFEQYICSVQEPKITYCSADISIVCVNKNMRPQALPPELLEN